MWEAILVPLGGGGVQVRVLRTPSHLNAAGEGSADRIAKQGGEAHPDNNRRWSEGPAVNPMRAALGLGPWVTRNLHPAACVSRRLMAAT